MRTAIAIATLVLAVVIGGTWAIAQTPGDTSPAGGLDLPFVFDADELKFDREKGVLTASGSVQIMQGERVLLADQVTYDRTRNRISARGNVTLIQPKGDVVFADRVELSGDFKDGVIEGLKMRLADNARLAAAGGRRTGGNRTEMRKAVYSACKPCKENPERAPTWQIKAAKAVHDEVYKEVEYTDAFIEIFGIPVLYTPYFSHPDPSVKHRSGILTPTYGSDSLLGAIVSVPFYVNIDPNEDVTVTPIYTSKEGVVLSAEYRRLFTIAMLTAEGSIKEGNSEDSSKEFRGHFFGKFGVDLTDHWRSRLDVAITTDDTYLRRYDFSSATTLINHLAVEGFWERDYAALNGYFFQGLRAEDDDGQTPIITPLLDYNFVGNPDTLGGIWRFDTNLLVLTRTSGRDTRRVSLKGGWHVPYTSPLGDTYRLFATLQTDGYWVEDQRDREAPNELTTDLIGRVFPQAGIDWRYPFIRPGEAGAAIVEPVAGAIFGRNLGRQDDIPNEDSQDFELDDTNIFAPSRFTGIDRLEGGHRVYYGLRTGYYSAGKGFATVFLGQSYRFRENASFASGSGLEGKFSDLVGRVHLAPTDWMDILYRFRLDNDLDPQRHDVITRLGNTRLSLNAQYIFIEQPLTVSEFGDREEISLKVDARIGERWAFGARLTQDLSEGGGERMRGANIKYTDDCVTIAVEYTRESFRDRDIKPSDSVFVRLTLRTLGEIGTGGKS